MKQHIDAKDILNLTEKEINKLLSYFNLTPIQYELHKVAIINVLSGNLTIGRMIEMLDKYDAEYIKCIFKYTDNTWSCCTNDDYEGYTRSHKELCDELWYIFKDKILSIRS